MIICYREREVSGDLNDDPQRVGRGDAGGGMERVANHSAQHPGGQPRILLGHPEVHAGSRAHSVVELQHLDVRSVIGVLRHAAHATAQLRAVLHRHGHVVYESSQFRAGIRAPAVGKIDELHNISLTSRNGAEVADTLKYFSERIPATFIYAGIDIEGSTLLSGTRGAQIAGRFTLIPTHPFPYNLEWKGLVAQMENTLLLHQHEPGSLAALDRYLHDRTGGMIGALSHLIRGAAIDAMLTGTEKITRDGLDAVPLDFAAQAATTGKPRAAR